MRCEEALLLISGHLDKENTPREEQELQQHLEQCEECRRILEQFQAADAGLLELESMPPEGFSDRVMESVRKKAAPGRKKGKWIAMGAMAAAVVLVMGIGYYTLPGMSMQDAAFAGGVETMVARSTAADGFAYTMEETVEDAVCEAQEPAAPAEAASAADEEKYAFDPADLAMELRAPVVVLKDRVPELDGLVPEQLPDGRELYLLSSPEEAARLGKLYSVMVYDPGTDAEVSFAVVGS